MAWLCGGGQANTCHGGSETLDKAGCNGNEQRKSQEEPQKSCLGFGQAYFGAAGDASRKLTDSLRKIARDVSRNLQP